MTGPASLSRADADAAIVALVAAYDRISAAMWGVDNHPGSALLRDTALTGQTATRAADLAARVRALWSQFNALGAQLDRARVVRGRRDRPGDAELQELTVLLRTPVVPLAPDGVVPDDPRRPDLVRWTLVDLARHLEQATADVENRLAELVAARSAVTDRFGPPLATLDGIRAVATELGPDGVSEDLLDEIAAGLGEAYGIGCADPLAMASGGPGNTELEKRLRLLTARLATLDALATSFVALRDGYPHRAEALHRALADLDAAHRAVTEVYAVTTEKIADTVLPAVPDPVPGLRAQLAQLDQMYRERRWTRLAGELAAAERAAEDAAGRLAELRSVAGGLLERRTELRGRLEAYQARAARLGFAENGGLSDLGRRAQELLWAAPCDLPAATRALAAYQRRLNDLSERGMA
ncbi:hypothetical protein [Plantactinospora sp. KBS50]|uniref:hypothetical protein n=1 Tax=Plantactinospora sp. KBS50 TaxID=2024580 RepID=UPI000BAB19B4|nr:hypothetical protein [Plantactinospora sp. KBS50]ASW55877.1 hypothetical protein CIK06_19435 [Plantactinospora sp. KBS50]